MSVEASVFNGLIIGFPDVPDTLKLSFGPSFDSDQAGITSKDKLYIPVLNAQKFLENGILTLERIINERESETLYCLVKEGRSEFLKEAMADFEKYRCTNHRTMSVREKMEVVAKIITAVDGAEVFGPETILGY